MEFIMKAENFVILEKFSSLVEKEKGFKRFETIFVNDDAYWSSRNN